jgi:hypothetical protein
MGTEQDAKDINVIETWNLLSRNTPFRKGDG